jgi:hypothetical protein
MNRKLNKKNKENIKDAIKPSECDNGISKFIEEKIIYIQEIIRNTIISIKKCVLYEIFSNTDANLSITILNDLYLKTKTILEKKRTLSDKDAEICLDSMQKIIDKLSMLISGFGTKHIEDLLFITFGSEFKNLKVENDLFQSKYELIVKYIQPTGFKVINWKQIKTSSNSENTLCSNKITD